MALFFRNTLIVCFLISALGSVFGQKNWKEITTVEALCENYPALIQNMFIQFDLDYPGMENVKAAKEKGRMADACNHLLAYYKTSKTASHLRRKPPVKTDETDALADTILNNVFTIQNVRGEVPVVEDGHRDWYYTGPNNDKEWAWLLNRHDQLGSVFDTYMETGNLKYLRYIDLFLRDFIIKSQPYPAKKGWGSIWRGLEVSFRGKQWTRIFYGLINNEQVSPATQLLILSSLPDHADYNRQYHLGGNWLTMELSALAVVAANFPEYRKSDEWLEYAMRKMTESIKEQVYSDGVQKELASHYHHVALTNFEEFQATCELAGKNIPGTFTQTLEKMYDYLAKSIRPNGFGALTNDSDLNYNRDTILVAAKKYDRPDWEYMVTNGVSGIQPKGEVSYFYPWAGQLISRSGYTQDGHWSMFDIGPWGIGHQHNDKLHISVSAYGKDLLVDAGRFAYTGEVAKKFRSYALGSAAHNIIMIDGKGQGQGPPVAKEPLGKNTYKITDEFDFATSSFDAYNNVEGEVKHIRSVFYVRGDFWVIVDRILTDRPRHIETLWHWHPRCKVLQDGPVVKTDHDEGNLAIIPVGSHNFGIDLIKGREKPTPQGWYSSMYNVYEQNVASSYGIDISSNSTFIWILQPSKKKVPLLRSKILSENDNEIKLEVKSKKNTYLINIPYFDSAEAALKVN
ncbi:heparinase [Fulvivirga sp. M361]|uniref:alginate lyase family protein n=1 Tax=Fulvivirga sp. M361 TaxID=2594266 RepID=UPI00117A84A0|nr:alginate lyase family protein [Fulvivirga sp. M361]TRX60588.1 heparinase [Fulvivirga sp. M361]